MRVDWVNLLNSIFSRIHIRQELYFRYLKISLQTALLREKRFSKIIIKHPDIISYKLSNILVVLWLVNFSQGKLQFFSNEWIDCLNRSEKPIAQNNLFLQSRRTTFYCHQMDIYNSFHVVSSYGTITRYIHRELHKITFIDVTNWWE